MSHTETSTRVAPDPVAHASRHHWANAVTALLLALAATLFALHYLHLAADFPLGTPWMDWAKYTDEGWYGSAAIRFFTDGGQWFVPGDFNPAVALPVWPVLEGLLFRLTGVGIVPARALSVSLFGLSALCAAHLVRHALRDLAAARPSAASSPVPSLAAAGLLVLLAASPFCFVFSRMAVLEPLLVFLGLLALVAASTLQPPLPGRRSLRPAFAVGVLLPLMVLTKTTALFLVPSILWMLWARSGGRVRSALPPVLTAATLGLALWLLYFGLLIHSRFLADYRYLFTANAYTGITRATALQVLADTVRDGRWIGPVLFPVTLFAALLAVAFPPLRRQPLVASLLLWIIGYGAFLAYHNNLQPRYYLVVAVPLLTLLPLTLGGLWIGSGVRHEEVRRPLRAAVLLGGCLLALICARESATTLGYARTPRYTFLSAARAVASIINSDPHHSRLLLSISGADISLMTGIPSLCDDFGTFDLYDRIDLYKPGWYAAWNHIEDDKMDALAPQFHLKRIAALPAYDDPERNLLLLYRLDTPGEHRAQRPHTRRPIPRRLLTRSGQQPSTNQLQH